MSTTLTIWIYVQCIIMFILGQLISLFLIDIPETRKLSRIANHTFSWKEWWQKEWNVVIGVQLIGIVVFMGLDQLLHWKPQILDKVKWFFAIFGIVGSGIAARIGAYRRTILTVIDKKTNIADGITEQQKPNP